jgi:hypothetical protein
MARSAIRLSRNRKKPKIGEKEIGKDPFPPTNPGIQLFITDGNVENSILAPLALEKCIQKVANFFPSNVAGNAGSPFFKNFESLFDYPDAPITSKALISNIVLTALARQSLEIKPPLNRSAPPHPTPPN